MTKVDTKNYYIMPIDEMEEDYNVKDMYVLYMSDGSEDIDVAILDPELSNDMPAVANIDGLEKSSYAKVFVDATFVTDRPIYKILISTNRTVAKYEIINDYDVELKDIIKGKDKEETSEEIEPTSIKK